MASSCLSFPPGTPASLEPRFCLWDALCECYLASALQPGDCGAGYLLTEFPKYLLRIDSLCLYSRYLLLTCCFQVRPLPTHNSPCRAITCCCVSGCWAGPHPSTCKEDLPSIASLTLGDKSSSRQWSLPGCPMTLESCQTHGTGI